MKKIVILFAVCAAAFSCTKNEMNQDLPSAKVEFVGKMTDTGKVSLDQGTNTWDKKDQIMVFSVANGAEAGVSVSANLAYEATDSGAETGFSAVNGSVTPSDKYYAFYPYSDKYTQNFKAVEGVVPAQAEGSAICDYRYVPVMSNYKIYFTVDPETGLSENTTDKKSYYATAAASTSGQPVELEFKPVLSVLEFAIYGTGTLKSVKVEYLDPATDVLRQSENIWLTGKGLLDLSTGTLTSTNCHATQYGQLLGMITEKGSGNSYVTLSEDKPVRLQFVVGRFVVTKGLKLTFTDKGGKTTTKTIWTDKTYTGYDTEAGCCKHIFQPVVLPAFSITGDNLEFATAGGSKTFTVSSSTPWAVSEKPDWITLSPDNGSRGNTTVTVTAASNNGGMRSGEIKLSNNDKLGGTVSVSQEGSSTDYYSIALTGIDWTASNVHYAKDASSNVIAMVTKEYFGGSVDKQGIVVYPAVSGNPDYTKGFVAEVTIDGGEAPDGNIHGGTVSFSSMKASEVNYAAGTSAAVSTVYVVPGVSALGEAPAGTSLGSLTVSPLTVTSDVKSHPCTKVGTAIWLAANYHTSKLADGTDIAKFNNEDAIWPNKAGKYSYTVVHDETRGDFYCYNFWTIGYLSTEGSGNDFIVDINTGIFAPSGWHVATRKEIIEDMLPYMGEGSAIWNNVCGQGLLNWGVMAKADKVNNKVAHGILTYGSVLSSTGGKVSGSSKCCLCGVDSEGTIKNNQQAVVSAYCVRLVKNKE